MSLLSLARSRAEQALKQSGLPPLRKLAVEETDAQVTISGAVSSYYHKQLAQETIMPHLGNRELINRVRVVVESPEEV